MVLRSPSSVIVYPGGSLNPAIALSTLSLMWVTAWTSR